MRNSGQTGWNLVNPAVDKFPFALRVRPGETPLVALQWGAKPGLLLRGEAKPVAFRKNGNLDSAG